MEFIGAHINASSAPLPSTSADVKVDAKASPAPVLSNGGLGSG